MSTAVVLLLGPSATRLQQGAAPARRWLARWQARADVEPACAAAEQAIAALYGWSTLPTAAALARLHDPQYDPEQRYVLASWMHARAEPAGVRLLADAAALKLSDAQLAQMKSACAEVLAQSSLRLAAELPDAWLLAVPEQAPTVDLMSPAEVMGLNLSLALPSGRYWLGLFNALQIELAQVQPAANTLWLHGLSHGQAPTRRPRSVRSDDAAVQAVQALAAASPAAVEPYQLIDLRLGNLDTLIAALTTASGTVRLQLPDGSGWTHRPWHRLRVWRRATR